MPAAANEFFWDTTGYDTISFEFRIDALADAAGAKTDVRFTFTIGGASSSVFFTFLTALDLKCDKISATSAVERYRVLALGTSHKMEISRGVVRLDGQLLFNDLPQGLITSAAWTGSAGFLGSTVTIANRYGWYQA